MPELEPRPPRDTDPDPESELPADDPPLPAELPPDPDERVVLPVLAILALFTGGGLALYVGRARDLRARLRSYFAGGRQRPAVEAALGGVAHAVDHRRRPRERDAAKLVGQ